MSTAPAVAATCEQASKDLIMLCAEIAVVPGINHLARNHERCGPARTLSPCRLRDFLASQQRIDCLWMKARYRVHKRSLSVVVGATCSKSNLLEYQQGFGVCGVPESSCMHQRSCVAEPLYNACGAHNLLAQEQSLKNIEAVALNALASFRVAASSDTSEQIIARASVLYKSWHMLL